jgi:hypothetical protein
MARSQANLKFGAFNGLRGLSREAKLLYFELLIEPTVNQAGVGALRERLWAREVELTMAETEKALQELDEQRYVLMDVETEEILVRTLIRNDGVAEKPNLLWAACRAAPMVQSPRLRRVLAEELRKLPPKPEPTVGKNGKAYQHPDPHATADAIDPGPGSDDPTREPSPNGSRTIPEPSRNHSRTSGGGGGGGGEGLVGKNSTSVRAAKRDAEEIREDVESLCKHLRDRIVDNGSKPPAASHAKGWRTAARLLLDRDKRDLAEAHRLIDWCQDSTFWRGNVLSMPKFREQYDALRLRALAENGGHLRVVPEPSRPTDPDTAFADLRQRAAAQEAANLLPGVVWIEPAQPMNDPTPPRQWTRDRAVEFIDRHEQALRAALTERKTG